MWVGVAAACGVVAGEWTCGEVCRCVGVVGSGMVNLRGSKSVRGEAEAEGGKEGGRSSEGE